MASKPVLGYWDYRGFGHPIRFLLAYLEVDYDEKTYSVGPPPEYNMENWLQEKFDLGLDFPKVPYWKEGELKITQFKAILRHITRTKGPHLYPTNPTLAVYGDMLETVMTDIWMNLAGVCYDTLHLKTLFPYGKLNPKSFSNFLNFWVIKNGFWGKIYPFWISFFTNVRKPKKVHHKVYDWKLLRGFPNFDEYMKRFEDLPRIKEYIKSAQFISGPCISPRAKVPI